MAKKAAVAIHANSNLRRRFMERCLGASASRQLNQVAHENVIDLLVGKRLLGEQEARAVNMEARARGVPVHQVIGEQGAVPQDKIVEAIEQSDVGRLSNSLDFDVRMPRDILRKFKIVIHGQTDRKVVFSTASTPNLVKQQLAPYVNGREMIEISFSWTKWREFEQGIDRVFEPGTERQSYDDYREAKSIISPYVNDAEVLDLLVDHAAENGCSDIHIEPTKSGYNVFFRHLGIRKLVHSGSSEQFHRICAMAKDRSRMDPVETRVPQDGAFSTQVRGKPFELRVATVPTQGKEKITMRVLDPVRASKQLTQLGITHVTAWKNICEYRNGIVLIVGATGSGKTTTLNSTVREMDRLGKAIYTAEDPVEYNIPNVTHVGMNDNVGLNYAKAVKAFMRSDPDVIVLGEIRDPETAAKAIQAAETGHLVIATIHAESVPMALQRLRGLDVKTEDFEMLLRGVLVQFLVRTLCPDCKGAKCEACFNTGYAGRTVVSEIARVRRPADVKKMMSPEPEDKYWPPLWQDLEGKLVAGLTDGAEIYRCFSSELEEMAEHSEPLAKVLAEERAKRDVVSRKIAAAAVESASDAEKAQVRAGALAHLISQDAGKGSGKGGTRKAANPEG